MTTRRIPSDPAAPAVELVGEMLPGDRTVDVLVQLAPAVELGAVDVLVAVELVRVPGRPRRSPPRRPAPAVVRGFMQLAPGAPAELGKEQDDALAVKLAVRLAAVDVLAAVKLAGELGSALAAVLASAGAVELGAVDVLVGVELVGSPATELRAVEALASALRARARARGDKLTHWRGARGAVQFVSARRGRPTPVRHLPSRDRPPASRIEPARQKLKKDALGERSAVLVVPNRVEPVAGEPCDSAEHDRERRRQRVPAGREHDQADDHYEPADDPERERAQPPRDDQDKGSGGKGGEHSTASWGGVPR